jgi:hypothetical protein
MLIEANNLDIETYKNKLEFFLMVDQNNFLSKIQLPIQLFSVHGQSFY